MNIYGIILLIIVLLTIIFLIFSRNLWYRLNEKRSWVISIIAIIFFLYFLILRFIPDVKKLVDVLSSNNNSSINELQMSIYFSKALLLDMCPLMAFMLPIVMVFDKKKTFAKVISPVAMIGSFITIFGQAITDDTQPINNASEFLKYIFLGIGQNKIYFMMHFMSLILSIISLNVSSRFNLRSLIYTSVFYVVWFAYVISLVKILNIQCNATGLVEYDWVNEFGQYHKVYSMLEIPFPFVTMFWYALALVANFLIALIKNLFTYDPNHPNHIFQRSFWRMEMVQL